MACNPCDGSGAQDTSSAGTSVAKPQEQGVPKPLAVSGGGLTYTQPGGPLTYQAPTQQPTPGMSTMEYRVPEGVDVNTQRLPSNTNGTFTFDDMYAARQNNGYYGGASQQQQSQQQPVAPDRGGGYQVAPVAPPTPAPVTSSTGYQPGTQGLGGPFGNVQTTLNTSNLPQLPSGESLMKMLQDSRDAAYKNATAYLDPQFANQESALRSQLTNQGIPQNSEAWNKAMDDFGRQKQFAYQQAQSNAVNQGNVAQNQLFGQGLAANQNQFGQNLAGGQFGNAAQNQLAQQLLQQMGYGTQFGIAQMGNQLGNRTLDEQINQNNFNNTMGLRNQDINELLLQQQNPLQMYNLLMSGNNVQTPNFSQTPMANMQGVDINSILNSYMGTQNNAYNAQVGSQNSMLSGLGSLGAAAIAAF